MDIGPFDFILATGIDNSDGLCTAFDSAFGSLVSISAKAGVQYIIAVVSDASQSERTAGFLFALFTPFFAFYPPQTDRESGFGFYALDIGNFPTQATYIRSLPFSTNAQLTPTDVTPVEAGLANLYSYLPTEVSPERQSARVTTSSSSSFALRR